MKEKSNRRPKIAFFDYADVFEDFYPHYGVTQETFATTWHNTGSHVWLKIIQDKIGDVTWYELSLKPAIKESQNHYVDCKVKFVSSSFLHRKMWKFFYLGPFAAKSWKYYKAFGTLASYLSIASCQLIQTLIKDKPDVFLVTGVLAAI